VSAPDGCWIVSLYEEVLDDLEAGELSVEFEGREPQALLAWAFEQFAPRIAISTAFQIDGSVLIDMAHAIDPNVKVFTVDTGRLPQETFELVEQVRERYPGIDLEILAPEAEHVSRMVGRHGPNLFYRQVEHRLLCCQVRKVLPLTKHLHSLDAWITGLRRDQSPTRADAPKVGWDETHELWKANPLADWDDARCWDYIRARGLPYNELHDRGYASIGCIHCTKPGLGREGRWTGLDKTECGLHAGETTGAPAVPAEAAR